MADEIVPRCDNPTCKEQKKEGNGWYMGHVRVLAEGGVSVTVHHYDGRFSTEMLTWCSIPCIQQVIGKALDEPNSELSLQPCLNRATTEAVTGRIGKHKEPDLL